MHRDFKQYFQRPSYGTLDFQSCLYSPGGSPIQDSFCCSPESKNCFYSYTVQELAKRTTDETKVDLRYFTGTIEVTMYKGHVTMVKSCSLSWA